MLQDFLHHSVPVLLFFIAAVVALGLSLYYEKHRK